MDLKGNRKFLIALLTVLGNTGLMWFGKINDGVYSAVAIAIVGAYITGNVVQNIQTKQ